MENPFQDSCVMKGVSLAALAFANDVDGGDTRLAQIGLTGRPLYRWIHSVAKGSAITRILDDPLNPHIGLILGGPSDAMEISWKAGDHQVIWHASKALSLNTDEHNFVNGYLCTVGTEETTPGTPRNKSENPRETQGGMGCLYQ